MSNLPVTQGKERHSADEAVQLVSFELEGEEYGVDVLSVREIIRVPGITRMPNAPEHLDGIINLRGTVVPIVSLRRRFGLCDRESDRQSRILVMEVGSGLTGFVVDAVAEVIRITAGEIQPPPPITQGCAGQESITGVINQADRLLIVLDLDRLFNPEDMTAFAALNGGA